jgi:integrase/recombinase XerD
MLLGPAVHLPETNVQSLAPQLSADSRSPLTGRKGTLFPAVVGKTWQVFGSGVPRGVVWCKVRRCVSDAGIETATGGHNFPTMGITGYLTNGGRIEVAQRMAGHSNAKTTSLYDLRTDDLSVGQVERIGI